MEKSVGLQYIEKTAPAIIDLFEAIEKQKSNLAILRDANILQFEHSDSNDDVDPSRAQFHFNRAANFHEQLKHLTSQSIAVLYGAILQIAKQVTSLAFEEKPPLKGRLIETQHLSVVIWHGRNQAMHWENEFTEKYPYTKACFEALAKECGAQFEVKQPLRNMAWDTCKEIGWSSYENYEKDMQEILEV